MFLNLFMVDCPHFEHVDNPFYELQTRAEISIAPPQGARNFCSDTRPESWVDPLSWPYNGSQTVVGMGLQVGSTAWASPFPAAHHLSPPTQLSVRKTFNKNGRRRTAQEEASPP